MISVIPVSVESQYKVALAKMSKQSMSTFGQHENAFYFYQPHGNSSTVLVL